ncbi:MAG: hypothetical protein Q7S23_03695 [bacterium]|nr:hypothetical protein [bacterium]
MSSERWSDRRFLLGVAAALAALSSLPYLLGWLRATSQLQYLGLHGFAPGDTFVYYNYLWQVRDGHWLLQDQFTAEPGWPILNTYWLAAGILGNLLRLSIPLTFHLARLLTIPFALFALWVLGGRYFSGASRRAALVLMVFSGGISGYLLPFFRPSRELPGLYQLPLDLWTAESNVFLSAMHAGHMVAAFGMIAGIFVAFERAVATRQFRYSVLGGSMTLALLSFHPFHAPLVAGVLGCWWLLLAATQRRARLDVIGHLLVGAAIAAPIVAYYAAAVAADPLTTGRAARNLQLTPAWYLLVPSFGLLLVGALIGGRQLARMGQLREPRWLLLVAWVAAQSMLLYAPFTFQRRLVTGLVLPLALLTVAGWPAVAVWLRRRWPQLFSAQRSLPFLAPLALLLLFGFSNMVNLANDLGLMVQRHPLVFWPREELAAIGGIRSRTDANAVVLALPESSYVIAGLAGRTVVLGHDVETLDYEAKRVAAAWFFQPGSADVRRALLADWGVTHVYGSARDGGTAMLDALPFLSSIYRNATAAVYRVQ